jgi:hypothetical protein
MNEDFTDRLRDLPPELPDVTDRFDRVRRRASRRRHRQVGLAAAATVLAVVVPVGLVSGLPNGATPARPARHVTATSGLAQLAAACPARGLVISSLSAADHMTHTAAQVRTALNLVPGWPRTVRAIYPALVKNPVALKVGEGSATTLRRMWVVSRVTSVPQPAGSNETGGRGPDETLPLTKIATLSLVDDAGLRPAGSFDCAPIDATQANGGYGIAAGSTVAATGPVGRDGTGEVLCPGDVAVVTDSGFGSGLSCPDQVALVGMGRLVARSVGASRYVSGIWQSDGLHVTSVGPPRSEDADASLTTPPCATPPGGWATVAPSKTPNLDDAAFDHYKSAHPSVVVTVASFRPSDLAPVLTIASTDPVATRAALASSYPRALCVVRSKFSVEQVRQGRRDVRHAFLANRLPGADGFGSGVGSDGQPTIDLMVLNDRPALHIQLAKVAPGLLRIEPSLHILAPPSS